MIAKKIGRCCKGRKKANSQADLALYSKLNTGANMVAKIDIDALKIQEKIKYK